MSSTFLICVSRSITDKTASVLIYWLLLAVKTEVTSLSDFLLFGGDADGLSIAICYGASKSYAPTHNIATYHQILLVMALCCDYVSEQNFEPSCIYGRFLFSLNVESFELKTWVIYHLIKSSRRCFWYCAFLLSPLKFDGTASSHFSIAPYHMHHLTSVFITLSKSVSVWCNLECILYNLVVIECFRWPLLDCCLLELYLAPHPLDSPWVSHIPLTIK
jgi:hypothetical protein